MTAADDDVPAELFAREIARLSGEGMNEQEATLHVALAVAGWTLGQADQAIVADTLADLRPAMDQVHRVLDALVERAMREAEPPRRLHDAPPGAALFGHQIAKARGEGMNESAAKVLAALAVAAWTIAQSKQAETLTDLRPQLDRVHRELDALTEAAMRFDEAPQRGRP